MPNFQNWSAVGAQALVTGKAEVQPGGNLRVEFRLWDVLPQAQIQGTAYTTTQSNWRRIAHIIADVIYERLLGEKGYFDTRVAYISATGPRDRRTKRLAIMDQDSENNRFLTDGILAGADAAFHPTRDEIAFMSYANNRPAGVPVQPADRPTERAGRLPRHDLLAALFTGWQQGDHVGGEGGGSDIVAVDWRSRSRSRRLTNSGSIDVSPCYSPDGTQIAFNSDRGGDQQLYVMDADGSDAKRISFGKGRYAHAGVVAARRPDRLYTRSAATTRTSPSASCTRTASRRAHPVEGWDVEGPTFCPNGRVLMFWRETPAATPRRQVLLAAGFDRYHRLQRARGADTDRRLRPGLVAIGRLNGAAVSCRAAGVAGMNGKVTARTCGRVHIAQLWAARRSMADKALTQDNRNRQTPTMHTAPWPAKQ